MVPIKIKTKILKKIVVIGASNSSKSINRKFAKFAANSLKLDCKIKELVLNDFEMPIYSEDLQRDSGIPVKAFNFKRVISSSDGIIISLAEHNGSYTSAFKNIYASSRNFMCYHRIGLHHNLVYNTHKRFAL